MVIVVCMTGEETVLSHSEIAEGNSAGSFPRGEYGKCENCSQSISHVLHHVFKLTDWVMTGVTLALELRIS